MSSERHGIEMATRRARSIKENEASYPMPVVQELAVFRDDLMFLIWPPLSAPHGWPIGREYNSKDMLLHLANRAISGLGADHACFISDGYSINAKLAENAGSNLETASQTIWNSESGRALQDRFGGSMSAAWEAGAAEEFGIHEAMVITTVSRSPGGCSGQAGFIHYVDHRDRIEWLEEVMNPFDEVAGLVFESIRDAFEQPDLLDFVANGEHDLRSEVDDLFERSDMPENKQRFHCDIAVLRTLAESGAIIGFGGGTSKISHDYKRAINEHGWGPEGAVRAYGPRPNRAQRREEQRQAHRRGQRGF